MANRAVVAVGVAALITGSLWLVEPHVDQKDQQWFQEQQRQQQIQDLSDSQEMSDSRKREAGNDLVNAENSGKNVPGEHRPPVKDPKPHVKIRLFP